MNCKETLHWAIFGIFYPACNFEVYKTRVSPEPKYCALHQFLLSHQVERTFCGNNIDQRIWAIDLGFFSGNLDNRQLNSHTQQQPYLFTFCLKLMSHHPHINLTLIPPLCMLFLLRTATDVSLLKETRLEQRLAGHLIRFYHRTHVQIKVCSVEASCCCSVFPFLENTFHASGMRLYHNTQVRMDFRIV